MPVDWNDLKFFLAIVRNGSVRSAAQDLRVAHSTVSRRIEALERALNTRVFDRLPEGLRITQAGEELLASAERVEDTMTSAERSLAGQDRRLAGDVRITLPLSIALSVLMPDMADFVRAYPDITLEIETSDTLLDLSKREADIALRFLRVGTSPPDHLVGRALCLNNLCTFATPDYVATHVFSGEERNAEWLGWDDTVALPRWVGETSFEPMPVRGRFNDLLLQVAAAREGLGMAFLPCVLGDPDPDLIRVPGAQVMPRFKIWILTHPDLRDTPRLRVFRDCITSAILARADLFEGRTENAPSG